MASVFVVLFVAAIVVLLAITSEPPQRVAIADLEGSASPMTGEWVTVEGAVDERLSRRALTVRDAEGDEPLLVVVYPTTIVDGVAPLVGPANPLGGVYRGDAPTEVDPPVQEDPLADQRGPVTGVAPVIPSSGPVRVVGTVDTFDRATVSAELGTALAVGSAESFDGDPFLRADVIETSFVPSTIPPQDSPRATIAD